MTRVATTKHAAPKKGVIPLQFVAQINKQKRKAGKKTISTSSGGGKRGKKHDHRVAGGVKAALTRKLRMGMFV